jgi:hypothetical protein
MAKWMTLCLVLSSFLLAGCHSVYKGMEKMQSPADCLLSLKPDFSRALYRTGVDVVGRHLGGLLLIKAMPDSSTRIVFSNEMGIKYFDFEFSANAEFKVYYILPQLNKKAVITTLRKDFALLLMRPLDPGKSFTLKKDSLIYYGFPQEKGNNYYVTRSNCDALIRMERASSKEPITIVSLAGAKGQVPDSIHFSHTKFEFTIGLKKLEP